MKTFADRLKSARKARGFTQKQLAAASGASQSTISDIERGRNETSADVVALARALGVLAEWLADGKGPRTLEEATGQPTAPAPTPPEKPDMRELSQAERLKRIRGAVTALLEAAGLDPNAVVIEPATGIYRAAEIREAVEKLVGMVWPNDHAMPPSAMADMVMLELQTRIKPASKRDIGHKKSQQTKKL